MADLRLPRINTLIISGRLTRDPGELRHTPGGSTVLDFSFVHDAWNGTEKVPEFHTVTCWNKAAEMVAEKLSKGRPIIIEGRLSREKKWRDKQGVEQSHTRIVAHRIHELARPEVREENQQTSDTETEDEEDDF